MLLPLVACNDSRLLGKGVIGDPMEAALLVLAGKGGIDPDARPERIAEVPFDAAHKYMATVHRDGDGLVMYVKGAPDVLLARCIEWLSVEGPRPLDHVRRQKIIDDYRGFAEAGLRGLLVARRHLPIAGAISNSEVEALTFVALLGIQDPPRSEAREAIDDRYVIALAST
jgi:Ca2+-transporting ATPase